MNHNKVNIHLFFGCREFRNSNKFIDKRLYNANLLLFFFVIKNNGLDIHFYNDHYISIIFLVVGQDFFSTYKKLFIYIYIYNENQYKIYFRHSLLNE